MGQDLDAIPELLEDFTTELRRANRTKATIDTYSRDIGYFVTFLEAQGIEPMADALTRDNIGSYIEDTLNRPNRRTGRPVTADYAHRQYRSLQQFCKYLEAEEILAVNPFDRMTPPHVPDKPIPVPTVDALRQLLAECEGTDFADRRDTAIIRLMADIGPRINEITNLDIDALDFSENTVMVIGKGRRPRTLPFGDKTRIALRRYLRVRKSHTQARDDNPALWLGQRGRMTSSGIQQMLYRRGTAAGIGHLHPHQLRHFFAHNWLASGGQEQDLMMLAGWRSRQMIGRYARATAATRAVDAHRKARLGDKL
ncbi:tyrosine-type recombinase/integrase [Nocardia sp. NBC_01503]|uniref:tyrosine-type recombinase/integrase n=1 Tax=Nocardia sp. NBC_01503 TaxID=2975997 RepID=UPI002E7ACFF0|nr:tyrosine-type recombinase/integrase [Nocardia sp. NBC_01503]WTL33255.1 tyrosine-type recombinase/integrase [Nocardia sp. NBC_01503]